MEYLFQHGNRKEHVLTATIVITPAEEGSLTLALTFLSFTLFGLLPGRSLVLGEACRQRRAKRQLEQDLAEKA